jgi:hypothetical protein
MTGDDARPQGQLARDEHAAEFRARKPYAPPRLTEYGPLAKLTQSGTFTTNGDAGQMMMI